MHGRLRDYLCKMHSLFFDIQSFIDGIAREDFLQDKRTQNAVAMSLLALGEIANTIHRQTPDWVEQNPQIAWKPMRGMRNIIAHSYFELDFVVVYDTAYTFIPPLMAELAKLIDELPE